MSGTEGCKKDFFDLEKWLAWAREQERAVGGLNLLPALAKKVQHATWKWLLKDSLPVGQRTLKTGILDFVVFAAVCPDNLSLGLARNSILSFYTLIQRLVLQRPKDSMSC